MNRRSFLSFLTKAPVGLPMAIAAADELLLDAYIRGAFSFPELGPAYVSGISTSRLFSIEELMRGLPVMKAADDALNKTLASVLDTEAKS